MAWVAPITFVAGVPPTAAQINAMLYTDLSLTMPALATGRGQFFVTTGVNSITGRSVVTDFRNGTDGPITVASTTYGNGTGAVSHPICSVTTTTGTSALAIWNSKCNISDTTNTSLIGQTSVDVSGATTIPASNSYAQSIQIDTTAPFGTYTASMPGSMMAYYFTGLTAGSNTFTLKYRVTTVATSGPNTFYGQSIAVIPF